MCCTFQIRQREVIKIFLVFIAALESNLQQYHYDAFCKWHAENLHSLLRGTRAPTVKGASRYWTPVYVLAKNCVAKTKVNA